MQTINQDLASSSFSSFPEYGKPWRTDDFFCQGGGGGKK